MKRPLVELCKKLGYQFSDPEHLRLALRHRSVGKCNNERLEYLGDAALGFIIANALYHRYGDLREGDLSRLRSSLVNGETLADIAREFELGDYLELGSGELKSGGFRRDSILEAAFEAIIAAILQDGGLTACQDWVESVFKSRLDAAGAQVEHKDAKTQLQELLQSRHLPLPVYEVVSISGSDHDQHFLVSCQVESVDGMTKGEGSSRRRAEQVAAKVYLDTVLVNV